MLNPIHQRVAGEQIAQRSRRAECEALAQEARRQLEQAHRREVERVRESVLRVPRADVDASRED